MSAIDQLLDNAASYPERSQERGHIDRHPRLKLSIVACMDSRMDLFKMLGLAVGDAHLLRNAGGVVTDDVIRSLVISQRALRTEEILLIHHTDCGLQTLSDDAFKDSIEQETGIRPAWAVESFRDPFADVRQSMNRIRHNPFLVTKDQVRGFVYDVDSRKLLEA
ncbi:MAG: carbonic anhydrase [Actinomycetota bacterium]|nr:carbonic anhydrase [Actinomycetota bacterium]